LVATFQFHIVNNYEHYNSVRIKTDGLSPITDTKLEIESINNELFTNCGLKF